MATCQSGSFSVALSSNSTTSTTVTYTVSGSASPNLDYSALSGTVIIPANTPSVSIPVPPLPRTNETSPSTTVTVTLSASSNSAYTISTATATVTISELPTVGIVEKANAVGGVAPTGGQFAITCPATFPAVSVAFSTAGSALAPKNYAALSSPVTLPANNGSAILTMALTANDNEPGPLTVVATLTPSSAYFVSTASTATVTISYPATLSISSYNTVFEGTTTAACQSGAGGFTVALSQAQASAVTVTYAVATSSTTVFNLATPGAEYVPLSGTVVIPAGSTSVHVAVVALPQSGEIHPITNVVVSLSSSSNAALAVSAAQVTIPIDELPTYVLQNNGNASQGNPAVNGEFTISRSTYFTSSAATIGITVSGTAQAPKDYAALGTSVTIPQNSQSVALNVILTPNDLEPNPVTVTVTLNPSPSYFVYSPPSTIDIVYPDASPTPRLTAAMILDLEPGTSPSSPIAFADVNGVALFAAIYPPNGWQIMRSDLTSAGTFPLGTGYFNPESGNQIASGAGKGFFTLADGSAWASDGTVAGTVKISAALGVGQAIAWNGATWFSGNGQLWKSDGTAAGTVLVSASPANPTGFTVSLDNKLYFTAGSLWTTNGTAAGTIPLTPAGVGVQSPPAVTHLANDRQLWPQAAVSNGTDVVYVVASSTSGGSQLWLSNGTTAGTRALAQPTWAAGTAPSVLFLDPVANILYFNADDGTHGNQLWITNGVSCTKIADLNPGTTSGQVIGPMNAVNGTIVFLASAAGGESGLWATDGTSAGTHFVTTVPSIAHASVSQLIPAVGQLYWEDNSTTPGSLMTTDGTASGTVAVIANNTENGYTQEDVLLAPIGTSLIWQGFDSTHGAEPWTLSFPPPTVAIPAAATPNPVSGTMVALNALGAYDGGESQLTYTWTSISTPAPVFGINGSNAAKSTTATFTQSGTYFFSVKIADKLSASVTSQVIVNVLPTLTSISISPPAAAVFSGSSLQFSASVKDQFGLPYPTTSPLTWSASGGGTISSSGLFQAANVSVPYAGVTASWSGCAGLAPIQVVTSANFAQKINFQPDTAATVTGYSVDDGSLYGLRANGFTYGWTLNQTDYVRKRGINANELLDTVNQFHVGSTWKMSVPNGSYNVLVSLGDPGFASSYTLNVNGINYCTNLALAINAFTQITKTIAVTNGLLTIDQGTAGDKATRIDYLEITSANPPGGYVIATTGNRLIPLGSTGSFVVTLAGTAGSHTISLTNGATFSDGTTSKTQTGPGSVSYIIKPGSSTGVFSVDVDGAPIDQVLGVTITVADVPTRTSDATHPVPLGIPVGVTDYLAVTIVGDLVDSGQRVGFGVKQLASSSGIVQVTSSATLNASGSFPIAGVTQATAANSQNQVIAFYNNDPTKPIAVTAHPFTVCNHPTLVEIGSPHPGYLAENGTPVYGATVLEQILSDGKPNGSPDQYGNPTNAGLSRCTIREEMTGVVTGLAEPFTGSTYTYEYQHGFLPASQLLSDGMFLGKPAFIYNDAKAGTMVIHQCHSFNCPLCGAAIIPVPYGGFDIHHVITPQTATYPVGPQTYLYQKVPAANTINQGTYTVTSGAGLGSVTAPAVPTSP